MQLQLTQPASPRADHLADARREFPRAVADIAALDVPGARHDDGRMGLAREQQLRDELGLVEARVQFPVPTARFFSPAGLLQIRYGTDSNADASDLDQLLIRGTSDTGTTQHAAAGTDRTPPAPPAPPAPRTGAAPPERRERRVGRQPAAPPARPAPPAPPAPPGRRQGRHDRDGGRGRREGGSTPFSMAVDRWRAGGIGSGQSVSTLATAELTGTATSGRTTSSSTPRRKSSATTTYRRACRPAR